MMGVRRDYSPSGAEEEWRRRGSQWRPLQFSRRGVMRTSIRGKNTGRRGADAGKRWGMSGWKQLGWIRPMVPAMGGPFNTVEGDGNEASRLEST